MSLSLVLAMLAVAGFAVYLGEFTALHFLPTGYHPVRQAVSDYGVGPYSRHFRIALYGNAAGMLALAGALTFASGTGSLPKRDLIFLALVGLGRIVMNFFPTDVEGAKHTTIGKIHYLLAIATFTFIYMSVTHMTSALCELSPWETMKAPLTWLSWLATPALVLLVVTMIRPLRKVFGIFERLFLVTSNLWAFLVAAGAVIHAGS
jgi:hypothetical protein